MALRIPDNISLNVNDSIPPSQQRDVQENSNGAINGTTPPEGNHLREKIGEIVAYTIKKIVKDFNERKEGCSKKISLLENGFWYPNEYFAALKKCNQSPRIDFFTKNGSFYHGFSNPKKTGFGQIANPQSATGIDPCQYRLQINTFTAAQALKAAQENLMLGDCAQLCKLSQYQGLLEILKEERFNKLFSTNPKDFLTIGSANSNPILVFLTFPNQSTSKGVKNARPINVGQLIAFRNTQKYSVKHMMGESASFNTICVDATPGQQKFVALGLPSSGISEDEMENLMVEKYNQDPLDFSMVNSNVEHIIKAGCDAKFLYYNNSFKNDKITVADLQKEGGGYVPEAASDFDLKIIELALTTPIKQLSIDFLKKHKQKQ